MYHQLNFAPIDGSGEGSGIAWFNRPGRLLGPHHLIALGYIILALVLRAATFGNPVVHTDEQLYLLFADRMLQGDLPYIDIWDRKPVGLFLLYAAIQAAFGPGPMAYQLIACLFAAGSAFLIQRLAQRIASRRASILAGASYLGLLGIFDLVSGQTPVFYNLAMLVAAWLLVRQIETRDPARLALRGAAAMLLIGLAIQIKYTAGFEGFAFGLILIAVARQQGARPLTIAALAGLWSLCAALPTLLALGYYIWLGHAAAFIDANFFSIFQRSAFASSTYPELFKNLIVLISFWLAAGISALRVRDAGGGFGTISPRSFPYLWLGAAVLAFLGFGTWYNHYLGPVLVPLAIAIAPALDAAGHQGKVWFGLLVAMPVLASPVVTATNIAIRGNAAEATHVAAIIQAERGNGCLYVHDGDTALYRLTQSCLPTRYVFPPHLATLEEASAIAGGQDHEIAAILARQPTVIAMVARPLGDNPNLPGRALVEREIARSYELYARPMLGKRTYLLYRLRPGPRPPGA